MQIRDSVYIDPDGNECHSDIDASDLREICDAALSAPPRNCDLYATVDEAFDDYLKAMEETPREAQVFIEMWLLSEAKGEAK